MAATLLRPAGSLLAIVLASLVVAGCRTTAKENAGWWIGTWSAPSLSRPDTPIIIGLEPGGIATEQVGRYRGSGVWLAAGDTAEIHWASGWLGLLRRTAGGVELQTWKAGTDIDGPPDDLQPARRR